MATQPIGYLKLHLYNTLSRKTEVFRPFYPQRVKVYTCGPTVYSSPHIGNFTAYIYWDLLIRTLKANGYIPFRILNLTDVGHLTSDADDGEDKMEKGAKQAGLSVWEVAEHYTKEFLSGYESLHLTPPDRLAKATGYIAEDIKLINVLTDKGYTYETRDGIYYDTSKFPAYPDFARLKLESLKAGARVEFSTEKRHASDFALWKFIQPGDTHAMRWDYLDRPGYPGWHIECSSIIHAELGETIDIHTGGIDHIPVHHTNEIAQSEAAFDRQLAKYWLHCNHLTSEGQKISKSLGNGYTLAELFQKGFSPLDFKMWVLQGHYRSERDFSLANLEAAKIRRLKWRNRLAACYQAQLFSKDSGVANSQDPTASLEQIKHAVNDDLNSAAAFAIIDQADHVSLDFWQGIEDLFDLDLFTDIEAAQDFALPILEERAIARSEKDYQKSDQLRDQLAEHNLTVLDSPHGQIWQFLS